MDSKELELIKQLREEANEVKRCVTTYSFAALTFSSAVFGAIAAAADTLEEIGFAGIPVIALLMVVCRIAIYKYSTANRNYGYELHLARLKGFGSTADPAILNAVKSIEWEEALRSWRVVQTAIFRAIYRVPENTSLGFLRFIDLRLYKINATVQKKVLEYKKKIKPEFFGERMKELSYPWFHPSCLAWDDKADYSSYHSGTYLQNLITMMELMQYFLMMPMVFLAVKSSTPMSLKIMYLIAIIVLIPLIFLRQKRIKRRREILEGEILSIHSCGIVWQAVVLAHVLAQKSCKNFCEHYTERLINQCDDLKKNIFEIHKWFNDKMGINESDTSGPDQSPCACPLDR